MALKPSRRLTTDRDLALAVKALTRQCAHMQKIHAQHGLPPLRDFNADFSGLAKIVVGQQLSIASANAIWSRVSAAIQPFEAERLFAMSDAGLANLGLSGGKIRTLNAVAGAVISGALNFARLNRRSDAVIHETLTSLHGIGPWTADIYLLFALRRTDAFAAGDLALQIAAQGLLGLDQRPTAIELVDIAERWRPFRAVAARLLWSHYGAARPAAKPAKTGQACSKG